MKVLLVNPPSLNEIIGNNPAIVEQERGYNPPLGLLYLAACVEREGRHPVSIIDAQVEELDYPALEARIKAAAPDVVGITAMTLTLIDVIKTVEAAKRACPGAAVALGGPHVHLFAEESIRLPGVDYLVLGEGEYAFMELLDAMGDSAKLRQLSGIVFRDGGQIVNTGFRELIADLDQIPFPARRLVPYMKYSSLMAKRTPITTMFTSRGCPYKCTFCDRPHLGKSFRARSAMNVVDEMEECVKLGIHEFLLYDDTFTVNRQRVLDVCSEIKRRRLDMGWDIRARVNTIDEELLRELKSANCERIHYGVEAGTEKTLKALNKGITIEQARRVFRMTAKAGISTLAYFMIGSPGETEADIRETMRVMRELDPDFVHITILTPFPGTQIYLDALERGIIKRDVWREFAANPTPDFQPPHWGEHFTREELSKLLIEAYKGFYTRPAYIARRLMKVSSFSELRRKVKAGLKVLGM